MSDDRLEKEILDDEALAKVNGGLDMVIGLPAATDEDRKTKKAKSTVLQAKTKKSASNLLFKEESIVNERPRKC